LFQKANRIGIVSFDGWLVKTLLVNFPESFVMSGCQ